MDVLRSMSGLALYEELRWRVRDDEKLHDLLGIKSNTPNLWRRRKTVPDEKREQILKELEKRLTPEEQQRDTLGNALTAIDAKMDLLVHAYNQNRQGRLRPRGAPRPPVAASGGT